MPLRPAARALALSAVVVAAPLLAACGDEPSAPRRVVPTADSLLVVALVGTYAYEDTVLLTWRTAAGPQFERTVARGTLVTAVGSTAATLTLRREGVDTVRASEIEPAYLAHRDSARGFLQVRGDSVHGTWLRRFIGQQAAPRDAATPAGFRWVFTDAAAEPCRGWLSFAAPSGSTERGCRVVVSWRRAD